MCTQVIAWSGLAGLLDQHEYSSCNPWRQTLNIYSTDISNDSHHTTFKVNIESKLTKQGIFYKFTHDKSQIISESESRGSMFYLF